MKIKVMPMKWVYRDKRLYHRLRQLTESPDSFFSCHLDNKMEIGRALLATNARRISGSDAYSIMGWGILHREADHYMAGFYVDEYVRRQGIGSALVEKARSIAHRYGKPMYGQRWDRCSFNFFRKNKVPGKYWTLYD